MQSKQVNGFLSLPPARQFLRAEQEEKLYFLVFIWFWKNVIDKEVSCWDGFQAYLVVLGYGLKTRPFAGMDQGVFKDFGKRKKLIDTGFFWSFLRIGLNVFWTVWFFGLGWMFGFSDLDVWFSLDLDSWFFWIWTVGFLLDLDFRIQSTSDTKVQGLTFLHNGNYALFSFYGLYGAISK